MRWLFIIAQCSAALVLVWLSATATEKIAVLLCGCGTGAVIVSLAVAGLIVDAAKRKPPWLAVIASSLALAVIATVIATDWPLRLTYVLSRPALQRLATAVQAGARPNSPVQAGLFVVKKAEISRHGVVCLWTKLQPSGNTGFVQCRMNGLPANLWSSIELDEQWFLVAED